MVADTRNTFTVQTIRCAGPGCSNLRRDDDLWFATTVQDGTFVCRPYFPTPLPQGLEKPVCGQACALRVFDQYLSDSNCARSRALRTSAGISNATSSGIGDQRIPPDRSSQATG